MGPEHPAGAIEGDRVFVLRFWMERATADSVLWRVKVSDLSSGTEKHLNSIDAALEHVRRLLSG